MSFGVEIETIITILNTYKSSKSPRFKYYIDMGNELTIFEDDLILYKGNLISFVDELMSYFNVKDDSKVKE